MDNETVKNTKLKTLKTKVNNYLCQKIPDATNVIYINEYNTDKIFTKNKVCRKILEMLIKKILNVSVLVIVTVRNAKISEVEN